MNRVATTLKSILLLISISGSLTALGQKEVRLYEKAEQQFALHNYEQALQLYKEVAEIAPDFEDTDYKITINTLLTGAGDEQPATEMLQYEDTYATSDDHFYYWLGLIHLRRYQIDEATAAFERFKQKLAYTGNEDPRTLALVDHAEELKYFFENPDDYEIHQLEAPVNSNAAELTPVYFEGNKELLFASNRGKSGERPFTIYYTKSGDNGWESPVEVKNLGNFTRENANIEVVNQDGRLFLFREEKGGDLFYSQASGDTWTLPVEFDARVSNNHLHSHFFINEHEDRIIFGSDEGADGLDLFESYKDPENGKWSKPAPFYLSINSPYNEDSPYLSPDEQTLYFSSDRPGGLGEYDVYVSYYDPATFTWSEPENMGWPINSPNKEFHFKMNADQKSGYFVSNRLHTKGDYDIYFFWHVDKVKVKGRIFDQASQGPLTGAEIRFRPSQYLDEFFTSPIDGQGYYQTDVFADEVFRVEILKDGKVLMTDKFEVHDTSGQNTTHIKDFTIE